MNTPLHICIDIRSLETDNRFRGHGYYIANLVSNILTLDKNNKYSFLVYDKKNPLYEAIINRGFQVFQVNRPKIRPRLWWLSDQIKIPALIKRISPDIFVAPDTNLPLMIVGSKKIKTAVIIHDLILLVLKDEYRLPLDRYLDFHLKMAAAKKASAILTSSEYSKKDIEKHLKVSTDKVKCIYGASDKSFSRATDAEILELKKKYNINKRYIMTVGDYYGSDPRKNYLFLIDSFAQFIKQKNDDFILLFVGKCGGKNNEHSKILARAKELGVSERIEFTDFVSDKDLAGFYSDSEAFVYPTKYEGFGLPILQAMSCGCPVIAARNTSIPEVSGVAAELFVTNDEESFSRALQSVLGKKKDYRKLGYENVKRFSWAQTAQEFIKFMSEFSKS